jgi:hypothetical protein
MLLDHGGTEASVRQGLVKLSKTPDFYFNPTSQRAAARSLVDPQSLPESRLFGQGAVLLARRASVGTVPTR